MPPLIVSNVEFDLNGGYTCKTGYSPIISSWQDCKQAAELLGFKGETVARVHYFVKKSVYPLGCFQSGQNDRFHFNQGPGRSSVDGDKILCKQQGSTSFFVEYYSVF